MRRPDVPPSPDPLHFEPLPGRVFYRVYWDDFGPLATHPRSTNRFALVAGVPPGVIVRPTIYIAESIAAALWEVVLRDVAPNAAGEVILPPGILSGRSVARLTLKDGVDASILRLDHPLRRFLVQANTAEDARWHSHCTSYVYGPTHRAAADLDARARTAGQLLPGLMWASRQLQTKLVGVLYRGPFDPADWMADEEVSLETPAGRNLVAEALRDAGMRLASATLPPDQLPPPGVV